MDQRFGITRILFNQSLTCPIAYTEMIRRYGIMTTTDREVFIESLDVGETGAMLAATAQFSDPMMQLIMMVSSGLDIDVADQFMVDIADHAAKLMNTTLDMMLLNDPHEELIKEGTKYLTQHIQR